MGNLVHHHLSSTSALTFQVRKRVLAVILREHVPDDLLPPPPIQTSLTESVQGNLVRNFLTQGGRPLVCLRVLFPWFVPRLIYICTRSIVYASNTGKARLLDGSTQHAMVRLCGMSECPKLGASVILSKELTRSQLGRQIYSLALHASP